MATPPIYAASSADEALRQGEILSDVIQFRLDITGLGEFPVGDHARGSKFMHPLVVVVSQDCDLDWDFKGRANLKSGKELPAVLLCEVNLATEIRNLPDVNSTIWTRIRANKDERYQFLERAPNNCDAQKAGLPEMALDFKRCFSIPTPELYLQVKNQAKRRCRLLSPYVEHLSHRLFYFHARIGLPADHFSEPEAK